MFAAPILINRSMTNHSAGVSRNGNRIKSKMAAKYWDKRTSVTTSETNIHHMTSSRPTLFFITFNSLIDEVEEKRLAEFFPSFYRTPLRIWQRWSGSRMPSSICPSRVRRPAPAHKAVNWSIARSSAESIDRLMRCSESLSAGVGRLAVAKFILPDWGG